MGHLFAHVPPSFDLIRMPQRPPLHPYPNWCLLSGQWRISSTASRWRPRVEILTSDSDGDGFLLLPLFDRTPVSRDIDCWSLAEMSKSWRAPTFCRCQYFVTFLYGGLVQTGQDNTGGYKSWQPAVASHLACMRWRQYLEEESTSEVREKLATVNFAGPKQ